MYAWICKSFCILQHGYFSNIHCTRIRGRYTRHRCAYNIFSMFCCVLLLLLLLPTSTCCSLLLQCMCWLWVVCWFHLPHYVFLKVLVNMFSSTSFLFYSSATYACVCKSIMKKSFPCVSNLYFVLLFLFMFPSPSLEKAFPLLKSSSVMFVHVSDVYCMWYKK